MRALIRLFDFLDIVNSYRKLEEATQGLYMVKSSRKILKIVRERRVRLDLKAEMLKIIKMSLNKIKCPI